MPVDVTRRIRTARLRGRSASLIRRGALLLEDALRMASLPGADRERVVLIRSLSLGVLRSDNSAAAVARQFEQQVAELMRSAVHGADLRAAAAPAVFFHDRLDAVVVLIQELGRGGSGAERKAWFWRSAVPGWQPGSTSIQAGRLLLGALLNLAVGAQSLAQAFQRLVESHSLEVILCALREEDGLVLLQRCGWRNADYSTDSLPVASATLRVLPFPRAWHPLLIQWVIRWGVSDPRSLWLVAVAVQSWRPESTPFPEVLSEARILLQTIVSARQSPFRSPVLDHLSQTQAFAEAQATGLADEPATFEEPSVQGAAPVYTPHAGFWFLISLLLRAGFGRAVQDHPEWVDAQVPRRLLRSLAERLRVSPEDPVWRWLLGNVESALGADAHGPDAIAAGDMDAVAGQWRQTLRRWCRIQARLGLVNLVRRPGWVSVSKTHVEVWMPLSDIDLRIRRAGLDIDPGWVPWLGQVIRFHYDIERRPHGSGGIVEH